ncbi:hypothetical protein ACHAW5_003930 [Stephanodiscus triporus]|uniref:Very-long-chain 3-oxoacyl-CoA synthase n=1 Tax=Stephanodiscus triporus TaxID=2934178 RepID=A0ABD3NZJ7_9STRA
MAIKKLPRWFNPIVVTFMQLSQMFIGVAVTVLAWYYYSHPIEGMGCHIRKENNVAAFVMYGSYFYLFAQFFDVDGITGVKVKGGGEQEEGGVTMLPLMVLFRSIYVGLDCFTSVIVLDELYAYLFSYILV